MDYKLELSKFHRYIDVENYEDFEKSLPKDYDESKENAVEKSVRLTYQRRKALPDSDFAVVVRVKDKRTGEMRKIRMFPIHDKAHVRNALARLGQTAPQATLRRLGVSVEVVRAKILRKARQLKMTQLLERYKKASKVEPKKIDTKKVKVEVKKVEPEKKIEAKKELEKKIKVGKDKEEAQKKDLELYTIEDKKAEKIVRDLAIYALEDKVAKYADGIRKLANKVRSTNKELKTAKVEKDEKVKFYKENAKKIHDRKVELGDFGKDLSDEDIVNDDKFEKAQLKKQVAEAKPIETASENVGDKITGIDEYNNIRKEIDKNAFPQEGNKK